jgi:chromosome segregation ATPase
MAGKESILRQMAAKLETLDSRLKDLRSGLDGSREQVRDRYNEEFAKLKAQRESLDRQMNTLKEAGADALKDLRSGLERGYKQLSKALDRARKHFRKEKGVEPPTPEATAGSAGT